MNKVYLYYLDINNITDDIYMKEYNKLTLDRKNKVNQYINMNNKKLSLGAEVLLKYGLNKLNLKFDNIIYKNEKPYFEKEKTYFNISHSGRYVICVISDKEVGCDIEKMIKSNLDIAEKFFNEKEIKNITDDDTFYRYWTLKESYIKYLGYGLTIPLNSFCINIDKVISVDNNKNLKFIEVNISKDYKCSICSMYDDVSIYEYKINDKK